MSINEFIAKQRAEEQALFAGIHKTITTEDKSVTPSIEPMMGKEMIVYKAGGIFKYGLASGKQHMSLHVLPIYGSPVLHARYKALFSKASFQKGCINFKNEDELPLPVVAQLIRDCSGIDLKKLREEQLKSRKKPAK